MAQIGFTPIQIYHSATAAAVPLAADLLQGELAINVADGKLYYKNASNVVQLLTSAGTGGGTVTSVDVSGGTTGLTVTGGPVTLSGTMTITGTLGLANGGTGQTTANAALNALLPNQATNSGKVLSTDGTNTSWITVSGGGGGTVTAVNATFPVTVTGTTTPTIGLANGAGAVTGSTGTGAMVCNTSPTLVSPILGTPSSATLTNATGLPLTTGVTGTLPVANGGTGVTSSTGTGNTVLSNSPTLASPILGTPTSGTLTNCTGLPLATGVSGTLSVLNGGTGIATSQIPGGVVYGVSSSQIATGVAGTSGQLLRSNGASAPSWTAQSNIIAGSVSSALSFSTGGSGTTSSYDGSVARSISYNSVGAPGLAANNAFTGTGTTTFAGGVRSTNGIGSGTSAANSIYMSIGSGGSAINWWSTATGNSVTSMFFSTSGNTPPQQAYVFSYSNSGVAAVAYQFYGDGTANKTGGGSWGSISDARLKENIQPLTGALSKITALNPVSYDWKINATNEPKVGFISQEVAQVIPNAVVSHASTEEENQFTDGNTLSIAWQADFNAYLVGAIKELSAKVTALEEQVLNLSVK